MRRRLEQGGSRDYHITKSFCMPINKMDVKIFRLKNKEVSRIQILHTEQKKNNNLFKHYARVRGRIVCSTSRVSQGK